MRLIIVLLLHFSRAATSSTVKYSCSTETRFRISWSRAPMWGCDSLIVGFARNCRLSPHNRKLLLALARNAAIVAVEVDRCAHVGDPRHHAVIVETAQLLKREVRGDQRSKHPAVAAIDQRAEDVAGPRGRYLGAEIVEQQAIVIAVLAQELRLTAFAELDEFDRQIGRRNKSPLGPSYDPLLLGLIQCVSKPAQQQAGRQVRLTNTARPGDKSTAGPDGEPIPCRGHLVAI